MGAESRGGREDTVFGGNEPLGAVLVDARPVDRLGGGAEEAPAGCLAVTVDPTLGAETAEAVDTAAGERRLAINAERPA